MVRWNFFDVILFIIYSGGVTGQYDSCNGQLDTIKDGRCDINNNIMECGYDGGDCCECSCTNDRLYPCGVRGFNCSDSDELGNVSGCPNIISSAKTCSRNNSQTRLVSDMFSAISLAEAVNCSGGTFYVTWRGSVLVNRTFFIPDGTSLYVTGDGSGAEVNGGGKTRLFTVEGGSLHVDGLALINGFATYGGAIAATRSSVFLNQTSSSGNIASTYGGAIYVGMNSTLALEGQAMLTDNHAGRGGGAIAVSINSNASWTGPTGFFSNTAVVDGGSGGAVYVNDHCMVSWSGVTSFQNNTAYSSGGAMFVADNSIVWWDAETSFVENTADSSGAGIFSWYSVVSWDGVTSFVNNTAYDGGAFYVLSSFVWWNGVTSFANNTAYGGGAFYVWSSFVWWNGVTSFFYNNAGLRGGAVYVSYSSILWDGVTSFVKTTAEFGGALDVYYSNIWWDGKTSFVNNTALYGSALRVEPNCVVSWDGVTSFVGNTAEYQGAFYVGWNSILSWNGETYFVNNTAENGGALSVYSNSSVSWTGETSFIENKAISSGGAVHVSASSSVTVRGDTYFLDNKAGIDGGAAFVYDSNSEISSYFTVDNSSTLLFRWNTCGGNGGAIALIGGVGTRFLPNATFWGNTAGVAGGAMYISGVPVGIQLKKNIFISNSAMIGGGLYSTISGTAETKDEHEILGYYPTTLIGCKFIGNEAMKKGGAIDSGAGRDMIVNTSFVGNTASIGGALRLVGTTSLIGCEFVENLSGDNEGPGISNDGVIASLSRCSFVDNVFNCQMGFYLDYNDTGARFDTSCKGCDAQCSECSFEGKEPMCLEEMKHSTSAGSNTTLESLLIDRGYWRATNRSINILACYNTEACLGGITGEKGYCLEGYEGPYCSVCRKGYTASLGFACNNCSDNAAGGIAIAVLTAAVFLFAFVGFISYMLSGGMGDADRSIVARLTRFFPLQSVKIIIVVWQILTQFSAVANVVFPGVYQTFLDGVDILNFDLSWAVSVRCIIVTDFHDQLLLSTLGPLVCMLILGGTFVAAMGRSRDSEEAQRIVRRKHVSMILLLTFLVYSSVSSTLFKAFACDKLDDGKNYLRADYRIECDSSKQKALEIYAGFMVVLYVIGIPAFYGVLLYNNREALMKNEGRERDESIKPIIDLWKPYRSHQFYYEVIECIRRVLLTGALVFIYPNTAAQIAVALMMTTLFIFVSEALAPYASPWDTWSSRTGHAIVFMSIFLALLLKVDVSGERSRSQRVFEFVLVGAHSCLILVVVVEAIAMVMAWRKEVQEDSEPRTRPLGV